MSKVIGGEAGEQRRVIYRLNYASNLGRRSISKPQKALGINIPDAITLRADKMIKQHRERPTDRFANSR